MTRRLCSSARLKHTTDDWLDEVDDNAAVIGMSAGAFFATGISKTADVSGAAEARAELLMISLARLAPRAPPKTAAEPRMLALAGGVVGQKALQIAVSGSKSDGQSRHTRIT